MIDSLSDIKPQRAFLRSLRDCAKESGSLAVVVGTLNRSSADAQGNFRKLSIRGIREPGMEGLIDCVLALKCTPEPEPVRIW